MKYFAVILDALLRADASLPYEPWVDQAWFALPDLYRTLYMHNSLTSLHFAFTSPLHLALTILVAGFSQHLLSGEKRIGYPGINSRPKFTKDP